MPPHRIAILVKSECWLLLLLLVNDDETATQRDEQSKYNNKTMEQKFTLQKINMHKAKAPKSPTTTATTATDTEMCEVFTFISIAINLLAFRLLL